MKRLLLTILIIPWYTFSAEIFLLPDHTDDALGALSYAIEHSTSEITLISSRLECDKLEKALVKKAVSPVNIMLILSPEHAFASSYLLQFKSVEMLTLDGLQGEVSGALAHTIILFDRREVCSLGMPLDVKRMRHDISLMECTRDEQRIQHYLRHAKTLQARAHTYLK